MKKPTKIIAMYLPQFHEITENNEWWGKGFTEWTNVKKAKPLFEGHLQPRVPYDEKYYDLSKPDVMQEQMKMAKQYGVDGFCIYHYWFHGKKLLEKPVEELLKRERTELPFFLCWANEPWTRTWDGDSGSKQILIDQSYGEKKEWKEHYEYLSKFFKHEDYMKIDQKPVFVIYKEQDLPDVKMFAYWNELAIRDGYGGIYLINTKRLNIKTFYPNYGDAFFDFEPFSTMGNMSERQKNSMIVKEVVKSEKSLLLYDYKMFCEYMVNKYAMKRNNHFLGACIGFDNSPRRGENTKWVFVNNTPENFEYYFRKQYVKSNDLENEFIFINAWNEWGEGAFLEPDTYYGFGYLEAIRKIKNEFM